MTAGALDLEQAIARVSSEIDEISLRALLDVLYLFPSPPGAERPLANAIAGWGKRTQPEIAWEVDVLDDRSGSLFARSAQGRSRELVIYGHLDTSLTGDAERDALITGTASEPPGLRVDAAARTVSGFGVGVAKAPSAAGVVAFLGAARMLRALGIAHRLTLFLAAGGTHRATPGERTTFGRGVTHALAGGWRPDAVLNVKAGPQGVLWEEPAAAYLRVRVISAWSAALARRTVAPGGGLVRHAGSVIDAVEAWRESYLAERGARDQLAAEIAIGAMRAGSPEKPDLLPGMLELFVYAVLLPGEEPDRVARDLAAFVAPWVARLPGSPRIEVEVYAAAPGGAADAQSDIVRLVTAAWAAQVGQTPPVRGWTGATDGALFLARGIPTARAGVRVTRDGADPRVEIVSLDELVQAARAYTETALRFFGRDGP